MILIRSNVGLPLFHSRFYGLVLGCWPLVCTLGTIGSQVSHWGASVEYESGLVWSFVVSMLLTLLR